MDTFLNAVSPSTIPKIEPVTHNLGVTTTVKPNQSLQMLGDLDIIG